MHWHTTYFRCTFSSKHNIQKSLGGLCFWAPDSLLYILGPQGLLGASRQRSDDAAEVFTLLFFKGCK